MVLPRHRSRAGALFFITLSLIAVVLCAPEESPKRAPSGFLGVRGKKDGGFSVEDPSYNEVLDKRAPAMGFQGVRGKKDQQEPLEQDAGFDKRGPSMGFHGMRGKKDPITQQEFLQEFLDKRAPNMGFMGMRGKKDPTDFDYFDKRAPSLGFQGMRGKKDQWEEDPDMYKRAPSAGFHGMRGKKDFDDGDFMAEKRMGFMGMRGKKESDFEGDDYPEGLADDDVWGDQDEEFTGGEDVNKRAPASGFFGMRGKKVPASGFFGMRGKKGPSVGFFAMRGKKAPSAGFMGMRGKKAPGSGFMGMRGKKDSEMEGAEDLDSLLQYLGAAYQHGREKRNGERAPASKKAPSGFLGTRGKKDWPSQQVLTAI
uniref:Preprotachykinin n=1 Tax=Periplaneta americana TaxID=6978 RepID=Q4G307_PERAM|nr:preprotachykinin [Periplaneta americana]